MVHGAHHGQPQGAHAEHTPAQTLHVVDDVVGRARQQLRGQGAQGAHAERERLGQEADPAGGELVEVERLEDAQRLRAGQHDRGVAREPAAPEAFVGQPRHRAREGHGVGVGRAHQHVDPMPQPRQLARQEPQVHALPAAAHVAPVGDEADAQRATHGRCAAERSCLFSV